MGGAVSGNRYDHSFSLDDSPVTPTRRRGEGEILSANYYDSSDNLYDEFGGGGQQTDAIIDGVDYDSLDHYDEDTLNTPVLQNRLVIIPLRRHPYIDYRFGNKLGEGAYSFVFKGISVKDNVTKVAIKEISIDKALGRGSPNDVAREINILSQLKHKCIVRLYNIYSVQEKTFLIMEYLKGGELLKAISKLSKYHEQLAKRVMKQITLGISYLHSRSVIHRDLKPENIILARKAIDSPVKIVDFGFAIVTERGAAKIQTDLVTGTPGYMAPEVYTDTTYYPATDVWSLGVVFYIMLSGMMPFNSKQKDRIIQGIFTFPDEFFSTVSSEAKDLITRMFEPNPLKRITAAQMLEHAWFEDIVEPSKLVEDNLVAKITSSGSDNTYTIDDLSNKSKSEAEGKRDDELEGKKDDSIGIRGIGRDQHITLQVVTRSDTTGDLTRNLEAIRKFESLRKFRTSVLVVTGYSKLKAAAKRRRSSSDEKGLLDTMIHALDTMSTAEGDNVDLAATSTDDQTTIDDMSPALLPDDCET